MNKKNSVMFNEDCNFYAATQYRKNPRPDIGKKELEDYIDLFKDTSVTDFIINVGGAAGAVSCYPSKSVTSAIEKYNITEELGQKVNYKDTSWIAFYYDLFVTKKLDVFQIWMDRAKKDGMNPWISFRMNDIHGATDGEIPNAGRSSFFYDHIKDYSRIRYRKDYGYYDRCQDFSIPEVRNQTLDYIIETLERYDPYGIELDFQREALCFSPGKEEGGYIKLLLQDIKKQVAVAEKRYNHKIRISIRCVPSPIDSFALGYDIGDFAKEGLVDLVIATPRWGNSNYDMPIQIWKQILDGTNVKLATGIEVIVRSNPFLPLGESVQCYHTVETLRGCIAYMLSQGSDIIYLYNFMDFAQILMKTQELEGWNKFIPKYKSVEQIMHDSYDIDSTEKILKSARRHIAVCEEFVPPWREATYVYQVPRTSINEKNPIFIRIVTGKILPEAPVILKLGLEDKTEVPKDITVFANGKPVKYLGKEDCGYPEFTKNKLYCFEMENDGNLTDSQIFEFIATDNPITIDHAEIAINIPFQK